MGHYDVAVDTKLAIRRAMRNGGSKALLRNYIAPVWEKNLAQQYPGKLDRVIDDILSIIDLTVVEGKTYFVSSETCQVVKAASSQLTEVVVEPEDIPTGTGFAYFESLVEGSSDDDVAEGVPLTHRAAAWTTNVNEDFVNIYWFTSIKDSERFLLAGGEPDDRLTAERFLQAVKEDLGYWFCSGFTTLAYGKEYKYEQMPGYVQLVALWLLMAQRATEEEDEPIHRKERKRAIRGGLNEDANSHISVIYLRGMRHHAEARFAEGKTGRLTYRFPVSGHWRNQWYPKAQRHRKKWIAPYIKGPQDGELKINEKVTVFRDKG